MSSDEQTIVAQRQTLADDATTDEEAGAGLEDQITRFRRIALPQSQWRVGRRQSHGVAVVVRVLAGVGLYCLPVIALCVALGALGYSLWIVIDVARSAGSLDFSRVGDAFGHFDDAARVFMASVAYILLALTLYLLAAAVRADVAWLPLAVALIVAAPVILFFTLSLDLALSLAPADIVPAWGRGAIEAVALAHTIFLGVLLRARRPVAQALNHLAFTRRYDVGTLYAGELPRLHVIRFASGAPPAASAAPPAVSESPASAPPVVAILATAILATATESTDLEKVDTVTDASAELPDESHQDIALPAGVLAEPEVDADTKDEPEAL
jgi:hypothetical protein